MHNADANPVFTLLLPLFLTLAIYLLPSLLAFARRHHRRWQILAGNVLLGWTFFIWCYCLIQALGPTYSGRRVDVE